MTMQKNRMNRLAGAVVALGLLAACEKHDAAAGQAASALNSVASQAGQKFDQATNYVEPAVGGYLAGYVGERCGGSRASQSGGRGERDKCGYRQRCKRYRCRPAVGRAQIAGLVGKLGFGSKRSERSIGNKFGQFVERFVRYVGGPWKRPLGYGQIGGSRLASRNLPRFSTP
jgi:hypothetical protein